MTFHGETGIARWKRTGGAADELVVSADLPESSTRFTRSVRVEGSIAYFEESGENLSRQGPVTRHPGRSSTTPR